AWALATAALTHDRVPLHSRTSAGHTFGLVLIVLLALTALGGFVALREADRRVLGARARRRVGIALIVAIALLPLGGVVALAGSSRGLTGQLSHVWRTLVN